VNIKAVPEPSKIKQSESKAPIETPSIVAPVHLKEEEEAKIPAETKAKQVSEKLSEHQQRDKCFDKVEQPDFEEITEPIAKTKKNIEEHGTRK